MTDLKTPNEWCAELGASVMDPDGWRDGTRSWHEPISRAEFDRRLIRCTIDSRGYPDFHGRRAMTDHRIFTGTDGTTAFLVTVYDDGTHEVATRPAAAGTFVAWSPPIELAEVPALGQVAS